MVRMSTNRPTNHAVILLIRPAAILYWLALTVLLLSPNPAGLVGVGRLPDFNVHFTVFLILTVLVRACRWRIGTALLTGILVAYSAATETLQLLVHTRVTSAQDYFDNLLGIAAGTALFWLSSKAAARIAARLTKS